MKTLYLGNRQDDVRELNDDDTVWVRPSSLAIGRVDHKSFKKAYLGVAWDSFKCQQKYFYYREKGNCKGNGDDVFQTPEAARAAAYSWVNRNNRNTTETVIDVKASDITAEVCDRFYWIEPANDWPYRHVPLDPYFIGLWLGDGTSSNTEVTTTDKEVISYLEAFAEGHGCTLTRCPERLRYSVVNKRGSANPVRDALRELGIWENKHIPELYMHNAEDVRIKVLAGLIDSDGTLDTNVYDITQKRLDLAVNIRDMARSLGVFSTIKERLARATNSAGGYKTYYRVFLHMTPSAPEFPLLLGYKQWQDGGTCLGIGMSLKKTQESFRHDWTPELIAKLEEVIPQYTDLFGRVHWVDIIEKEPVFADMTQDALRTIYSRACVVEADPINSENVIREKLVQVLGKYQSEYGNIQWNIMLANEPSLKGVPIQSMRTIIGKFTSEEELAVQQCKTAHEEEIARHLSEVVGRYKNARGGVSWDRMVQAEPILQGISTIHLKHMYKQLGSVPRGDIEDKREEMWERLLEMIQLPEYRLSTGKIQWKKVISGDPVFEGVHPDVLRNMYKKRVPVPGA